MRACWRDVALTLGAIAAWCSAPSCVQSELVPFGDTWCPPAAVFIDGECVTDTALRACAGKAAGEHCVAETGATSICVGAEPARCRLSMCGDGFVDERLREACDAGAGNRDERNAACRSDCTLPRCGDGLLDDAHGEVCDDGNVTAGDGCASDCRSAEVCGNRVLDSVNREQCDLGADGWAGRGCSYDCALEVPNWTRDATPNRGDRGGRFAFDEHRKVVVYFGGEAGNETWEYGPAGWYYVPVPRAPSARSSSALAYDPASKRLILHGGRIGQVWQNDTWFYDGFSWKPIVAEMAPPPRAYPHLAVAPWRNGLALLGAERTFLVGDVWQFDGADSAAPVLPEGSAHAASYDPSTQSIVELAPVAGGSTIAEYRFDASGWRLHSTSGMPNTTAGELAWHAGRQELWLLDGSSCWARRNHRWVTASSQCFLVRAAMSRPDTQRLGVIRMFYVPGQASTQFEYAEIDNSGDVLLSSDPLTRASIGALGVYDRRRGRIVLLGSSLGELGPARQVISYQPGRFQALAALPVGVSVNDAAAYDELRDRIVVVARGVGYEFDGGAWHNVGAAPPLSALAYAPDLGEVIGLGPASADGGKLAVWRYVNGQWREGPAGPPMRARFGFAYHRGQRALVILGGVSSDASAFTRYHDQWQWTAAAGWGQTASELAFGGPLMAFYWEASGQLVALPYEPDGSLQSAPLIEIAPQFWVEAPTPETLPKAYGGTVVVDPRRTSLVHLGGAVFSEGTNPKSDVWRLAWRAARNAPDWCLGDDSDGDGKVACGSTAAPADPDCWAQCTPLCSPADVPFGQWPAACDLTAPHCGDGVCDTSVENPRVCAQDCHE